MKLLPTLRQMSAVLTLAALLPAAWAQGFAAYVSPPRFEVQAKPGEALRQVLEIQHVGQEQGNYRVYTNDWTLGPDNGVTFSNELAPDSCRPWVAIERRELVIEPSARYRYRFEIAAPAGTAPRECRFAIMIEGLDPAQVKGNISFPVGGRIGVIVYARIGDATPELSIQSQQVVNVNGQPTATLSVRNVGNATGRLEGFLNATDAAGNSIEMSPADLPILPGETRSITLNPVVPEGQTLPEVTFPISVKGSLEWDDHRLPLEARFAP